MAKKPAPSRSAPGDAGDQAVPRLSRLSRLSALFKRCKPQYVVGLAVGFALSAGGIYFALREPQIPPGIRLKRALLHLDEGRNQPARNIALGLRSIGYQDPDFAGGVAFILGITSFRETDDLYYRRGEQPANGNAKPAGARETDDLDPGSRERSHENAVTELREAERLSLIKSRRPEWSYVLGVSLHRIGSADEAVMYLEEAVENYTPGKTTAALLLAETHLSSQMTESAEMALTMNDVVVKDPSLTPVEKDGAWLQRAQILLMLGRQKDAEEAKTHVSSDTLGNQGRLVVEAQTLMAEGNYRDALEKLEIVAKSDGLERTFLSQACYLRGVCAERLAELMAQRIQEFKAQNPGEPDSKLLSAMRDEMLGELDNAINYYQRTRELFEHSHEALAARLGLAEACRKRGRNEEALEFYSAVLREIRGPHNFRNRWFSLKRLRDIVVDAWTAWLDAGFYQEAIDLAELMSPAIPLDEACELVARANLRWSEHLEAETARLPYDKQLAQQEGLKLRWKRSGAAYSRLAETRRTSTAYNDALWTSAENYLKGHDFANAVEQLTRFIDTRATTLIPTALVRRGQALMDLDRTDEALRDFEETALAHPTDPAAFQARYLIGQCHFERNELDQAEKAWRKLLESNDLTPTALEWRKALCSLGKLLYYSSELTERRVRKTQTTGGESQETLARAYLRLDDAIARLEEFLDRYPTAPETAEVRFLLAKSLQKSAQLPEEKLKTAETDNARAEYRRQVLERLDRAIREYQQLQADLVALQVAGRLDKVGQVLLRNCYIDTAHCHFSLGRYEDAIVAYGNSAGRYQQDSDSLTAYMQIANCYDRLKRPAEALSTLAQAKLILKQLPDEAFPSTAGGMRRDDWQRWLDWAMRLHK